MVRVAFAYLCLTMLAACGASEGQNESATAAGTAHFVNSPDNARSMALRDAYVDFSFDYPARWSQTPQPIDGTAQNYVRVAAPMVNGYEPEAFLVGYASGTGNAARDRASIPAAARALAEQFGASLQDYHILSSAPGRIAGFESYGWRFTASAPGIGGEPRVQIYGRGDLILPPGASRGVTLVALATSRGDIHSAAEVGERGALRAILDSFHLAVSTAAPPAPSVANRPPDTAALRNETGTSPAPATPPETHPRTARSTPPATHAAPNAPPAPRAAPTATPPAAAPAPVPAPAAPAPTPPPPAPPRATPAGNDQ